MKHTLRCTSNKPFSHRQFSEQAAYLNYALEDERRLVSWGIAFLPFSDNHFVSEQKHMALLCSTCSCVTVPQDHILLES